MTSRRPMAHEIRCVIGANARQLAGGGGKIRGGKLVTLLLIAGH